MHSTMAGSDVTWGLLSAISNALSLTPTDLESPEGVAWEKPSKIR